MKRDGIALLMVGDELLDGRTPETNSHWLIEHFVARHWDVYGVEAIPDDVGAIAGALHRWTGAVGAVIVSGGLGPTPDDLTRDALAKVAGEDLEEDPELVRAIASMLERRGRAMSPSNRRQAVRPASSTPLRNEVGTAPGLWHEIDGTAVVLVPGVPTELRWMVEHEVDLRLAGHLVASTGVRRRLRTTGIAEARLAELVRDALAGAPETGDLAWCVARFGVDLIVRSRDQDVVDDVVGRLRAELAESIYGEGDDELNAVVVRDRTASGQTIALAESCTGGLVAGALTDVPGSSRVLTGAVVAYANAAKQSMLGVPAAAIEEHGAVSEPVARAMAEGVRARFAADYGLSTTGIAGPDGGTEDKPVGTVWLALATPDRTTARRLSLGGGRETIRRWTVAASLEALRRGEFPARR